MTPWHRFWFPEDNAPGKTRDAALWSSAALVELQHGLWHQAAEATAQWWRFVTAAWQARPLLPPSGQVEEPPTPRVPTAEPARPRKTRAVVAARAPARPSRRPRSTAARGK